jgi:hypothetical protein
MTLDFEETLAALLGLIGESAEVAMKVGPRGETTISAGFMRGRLQRAMNRGPSVMPDFDAGPEAWNDHDAHFFIVGQDDGTGFYLAPQMFEVARWLSPTRHDLWIEQGPYLVISVIAPSRVHPS